MDRLNPEHHKITGRFVSTHVGLGRMCVNVDDSEILRISHLGCTRILHVNSGK